MTDEYLRSLTLLESHLNEWQLETWRAATRPHIDVTAKIDTHPWSGRIFRIYREGPWLVDTDADFGYCVNPHPTCNVPRFDFILTLKLLLETDPVTLFRASNPGFVTKEHVENFRLGRGWMHYRPDGGFRSPMQL